MNIEYKISSLPINREDAQLLLRQLETLFQFLFHIGPEPGETDGKEAFRIRGELQQRVALVLDEEKVISVEETAPPSLLDVFDDQHKLDRDIIRRFSFEEAENRPDAFPVFFSESKSGEIFVKNFVLPGNTEPGYKHLPLLSA